MRYSRCSSPPRWWKEDDSKIYICATMGSSTSNEWYEFDDRPDALDLIGKVFKSQSFVDRFTEYNGEFYERDQFTEESMEIAEDSDDLVLKEGAQVADLQEMIEAESPF